MTHILTETPSSSTYRNDQRLFESLDKMIDFKKNSMHLLICKRSQNFISVSTARPINALSQQQALPLPIPSTCTERMGQLVGDIFIGHEMIPQVIDLPPEYPLELTYRTVRTFPGMRLTAEATRFKPMIHWPAEQGVLYTVIMSNLDINSRRNR